MIKLIVSDLDGTLLNSKKEIPDNLHLVIEELGRRNILFSAASGRSRESILNFFGDVPVTIIANNGGMAYSADGDLLFIGDFSYEMAKPILDIVSETPYMHAALCGLKGVYVEADSPDEHKEFVDLFFKNQVISVPKYKDAFVVDKIAKISINTGRHGRNEVAGKKLMEPFQDEFGLVLSGDGWVDLMRKDVSKGSTFIRICEHYDIDISETMIFGDYINDLDMLVRTPNSYAVANAHPDVKKVCAHVLPHTNEEQGVIRALADIFGMKEIPL